MVTIKDNHQYTESLPKDTLRSLRQKKAKHRLNYLDTNPKSMYGGNLAVRITTLLSTQLNTVVATSCCGEFCDSNGRPIRTEGKMNTEKLRDPE